MFQKSLKHPKPTDLASYKDIIFDPTNPNRVKNAADLIDVLQVAIIDEIVMPCTSAIVDHNNVKCQRSRELLSMSVAERDLIPGVSTRTL